MVVKIHKVRFREEASADILEIYRWVYEVSLDPATAQRFTGRLLAACERIGDTPLGGRSRDDLFPRLRIMPFEKRAVIAYLVGDDVVDITNVFYGGRDYEALYQSYKDDAQHENNR